LGFGLAGEMGQLAVGKPERFGFGQLFSSDAHEKLGAVSSKRRLVSMKNCGRVAADARRRKG
jgi:hypothetical protein